MRDNTIDEIKNRCDIVDIIGRVVSLKKTGSNFKGLCPFHNEKTPSFVVSEDKQIFTCFGCGATGDVISFVQKYDNLEFMEAVEKLAAECGVTIDNDYDGDSGEREMLYKINREAAKYFYMSFRSGENPGKKYMEKRGISEEILKKFGIGYADDRWESLFDYLTGLGFPAEKMIKLGLISQSKGKYYDKYRNRVMFPIINTSGKVIGFGGRAIGDAMPKYLNSQESSIFMKKNNLYGLNLTRQEISKENCAILVEGYMDVIGLYQGGVRNVSASLGTALTENQAKLLTRYTKNVVLSYDADDAGRAAALRGIEILNNQKCRVKVLHVTDGKDPDEFIKKQGRNEFLKLVDGALPYADYRIASAARKYDTDTAEGRLDFIKEAVAVLRSLSPVEADMYVKKLAADYDISEGAIRSEMALGAEKTMPEHRHSSTEETAAKPLTAIEKNLIKILITESRYLEKRADFDGYMTNPLCRNILSAMEKMYSRDSEFDTGELMAGLDDDSAEALRDIDENVLPVGDGAKAYADCIAGMKIDYLQKKEKLLIDKIAMAEGMDESVMNELMLEKMNTSKEIDTIRKRGK
ncbi:MAG: DNA primase [Eubacteriaceae bacterium]|jgi:DNA primase|nr:DNA primase [Eubacteriaceae bacterium]